MNDSDRIRQVLRTIAQLASSAAEERATQETPAVAGGGPDACTIKFLPPRLVVKAAEVATKINPVNAPAFGPLAAVGPPTALDKLQIAVLTAKYWGSTPRRLTVSFMEPAPADLRARILAHMNAWQTRACISFVETSGSGDVRISREPGGYWSYLGTDIKLVPASHQTMNLERFSMETPESEYKRVVRHETGHTLGFPHEHMRQELVARIDPAKAYRYFLATQGWDKQTVDHQVLSPLDQATIFGTPPDQTSIMCYQLPGSITYDGAPITGGVDINAWDYDFAALIYPKPVEERKAAAPALPSRPAEFGMAGVVPMLAQEGNGSPPYAQDWGAAQDPEVHV